MHKFLIGLLLSLWVAGTIPARAESLNLEQCLQLARQHNLTLQAEKTNPQLAAEKIRETRSVFLPQVDLSGGYTALAHPQEVIVGGRAEPTQDRNYPHFSLSAEQLLYDFHRSEARVTAARAQAQAAESTLASREQDLFLDTTRAYFQVLAGQQLLLSADEDVAQIEEHRRVVETLYTQGVVTRNDLLQANVRMAASRQTYMVRQGALENAWFDLNYLIGRPAAARGELVLPDASETAAMPGTADLEERPELVAQREQVTAAEAGVAENRNIFRPEVFARLGADYVDNSYVKEQTIYSATLGLRLNLFDGMAATSQLRQSHLTLDREQKRLKDMRAQVELEYRQASNDAEVAKRRIDVAQAAIAQAEENLRINRDRYREQVGTATEVLDAQTLLTQSRTDLAVAQYDYHVAVARVRRAAGKL